MHMLIVLKLHFISCEKNLSHPPFYCFSEKFYVIHESALQMEALSELCVKTLFLHSLYVLKDTRQIPVTPNETNKSVFSTCSEWAVFLFRFLKHGGQLQELCVLCMTLKHVSSLAVSVLIIQTSEACSKRRSNIIKIYLLR